MHDSVRVFVYMCMYMCVSAHVLACLCLCSNVTNCNPIKCMMSSITRYTVTLSNCRNIYSNSMILTYIERKKKYLNVLVHVHFLNWW